MRRKLIIISMLIVIIFSVVTILKHINNKSYDTAKYKINDNRFKTKLKSGNLSTDYTVEQAISDIKELKLNAINIPVVIKVDSLNSSEMLVEEYSIEKAIKLINELKPLDIKIILEPYPWINNGKDYETNWTPADINMFFYNWQNNVLSVLVEKIAKRYDVYAISIGSNLSHMEKHSEKWISAINYIREKYSGFITYRTSFWYTASWDKSTLKNFEDKLNNPLFEKLDFISVAAYFELTDRESNTVSQLVSCIDKSERLNRNQPIKDQIIDISKKWNKLIFFGELGFPRTNGCAIEPWNPNYSNKENFNEQARCFEAYKKQFENEPWHLGFSVFAIGEKGQDKKYYPSDKSKKIIRDFYRIDVMN